MPVFDFECQACGALSEILVRSDGKKPRCTACGSLKLKKSFSAPSIITKGGSAKKTSSSSRSSCAKSSCSGCRSHCH